MHTAVNDVKAATRELISPLVLAANGLNTGRRIGSALKEVQGLIRLIAHTHTKTLCLPHCFNPILNLLQALTTLMVSTSATPRNTMKERRVRVRAVKCQVFPCMYLRKCQKLLQDISQTQKWTQMWMVMRYWRFRSAYVCVCMCLNARTKGSGPIFFFFFFFFYSQTMTYNPGSRAGSLFIQHISFRRCFTGKKGWIKERTHGARATKTSN